MATIAPTTVSAMFRTARPAFAALSSGLVPGSADPSQQPPQPPQQAALRAEPVACEHPIETGQALRRVIAAARTQLCQNDIDASECSWLCLVTFDEGFGHEPRPVRQKYSLDGGKIGGYLLDRPGCISAFSPRDLVSRPLQSRLVFGKCDGTAGLCGHATARREENRRDQQQRQGDAEVYAPPGRGRGSSLGFLRPRCFEFQLLHVYVQVQVLAAHAEIEYRTTYVAAVRGTNKEDRMVPKAVPVRGPQRCARWRENGDHLDDDVGQA